MGTRTMKTGLGMLILCGCVLLIDGPSSAEDRPSVDCEDAVTQADINQCADLEYQEADKALNEQWARTKEVLAGWDADIDAPNRGAVADLTKAQRAWITYRDAQCDATGYSVWGGSLYQAVILGCLARVTRNRTTELKELAEGVE